MIEAKMSEQYCVSHECTVCGKKLRTNMSRGEKIFLGSLFLMWIVMVYLSYKAPKNECYTKEMIGKTESGIEIYKTVDVKCLIK